MSKHRWELSWMRLILSSMGMLAILMVVPVKGLANTFGSKSSEEDFLAIASPAAVSGTDDGAFRVNDPQIKQDTLVVDNPTPSETEKVTPVTEILRPSVRSPASRSPINNTAPIDGNSIVQVNSVSQLSDVKPTDWAFQALQSLVERYGCIEGYPDKTYRGNRALTRYEFAAGVNACLNRINELIATGTADLVAKEDLVSLQKLQEQFGAELAKLRGRLDALEVQTANLDQHQFSTTTILKGEAETVFGGILAGNNVLTRQPAPHTITFQNRIRLELNTSFTGKDQLRTQLTSGDIAVLGSVRGGVLGTNDGRTSDNITYPPNQVVLSGLRYQFPLTNSTIVNVFAQSDGAFALGLTTPINPYFEGSAANGISRYSRRNMVYDYGDTGAGVAVLQKFGKQLELGLEYTSINGNDPTPNNGLFQGRYVALGQLIYYTPSRDFRLGLTYANTYSPPGAGLGSTTGQNFGPAIGSNLANSTAGTGVVANLYGIEGFYKVSPGFAVNGWAGYSAHHYLGRGDGQVWDWAVGLAFPDLWKKANLGGLFVGMEPKLTGLSRSVNLGAGFGRADKDTSLHIEGFYQYQLTDNIAITPGVIWITAPDFDNRNADTLIAWLRTTIRF